MTVQPDEAFSTPPACFDPEYAWIERHEPPATQWDIDSERFADTAVPPGWDDPPEPEAEVIIPVAFLEAYAAAKDAAPEALRPDLDTAHGMIHAPSRRVLYGLPTRLLIPLGEYADDVIVGADHTTSPFLLQAAGALGSHVRGLAHDEALKINQAKDAAAERARRNGTSCPEGDDSACPTPTCGCPPF